MTKTLLAVFLFAATASAQDPYPADYTPSPCAAVVSCESFTKASFESAASHFLLMQLDGAWNEAHHAEMDAMMQPFCAKRATCIASPGRYAMWCHELFIGELRSNCKDKFTTDIDKEQCRVWSEVFAAGMSQHGAKDDKNAQDCLKGVPAPPVRKMVWWSKPAAIPADYDGIITIFALDPETHVPVRADVAFEGQPIFYSADSPNGRVMTDIPFVWPRWLIRAPNAAGHTDLVAGNMILTAAGYETVKAPVPAIIPTMVIKVTPPLEKIRRGATNRFTVNAADSATGKPVEAQVYAGTQTIGFTNQILELPLQKKEKRPEIWIRSPYDTYSDVVVAPAEK